MSSSDDDDDGGNNLKDPRFIVITSIFVLYGLFILSIMFCSGMSFWIAAWKVCKDFLRSIGLRVGRDGGERDDAEDISSVEEGTHYQLLSERSKRRLDTLRQLAIERLLLNYSLRLRKENLVLLQPQQKMNLDMNTNEGDSTTSSNTISIGPDVEEGLCTSSSNAGTTSEKGQDGDAKKEVKVYNENVHDDSDDSDELPYTHVLLPYPGVGLLDGLCIEASLSNEQLTMSNDSSNDDNEVGNGESEKEKGKWPFSWMHFAKRNEDEAHDDNDNDDTDNAVQQNNNTSKQHKQSRRQIPIFCSICLSEFDLHQQICWSSNSACTHVFHSDCMIQWLVSLGRKHSITKRFTFNPTERQLLGHYELQCPCCRQEFIKSALIERGLCEEGRSRV